MRFAQASHFRDVHIVGAVARGEERAGVEVIFLVTPEPEASREDFEQFRLDCELFLGRPVGVFSRPDVDPEYHRAFLAEAIAL